MQNKRIFVGVTLTCLVLSAIGYYFYRQLIEAGYPSCVLSIEDKIRREFLGGTLKHIPVTNDWQVLGEEEERALFTNFRSAGMRFDCKQFPQFADGSALVGSKGQIRFRQEGKVITVLIESDENHERPY